MAVIASHAGYRARKIAAENSARHHQESHRRHRVALLQHRHFADDGFRERVYECAGYSGFGDADLPDFAQPVRAAHRVGTLGKPWQKVPALVRRISRAEVAEL